MQNEYYWSIIMYILYDNNIFNDFESYVNKSSINKNIKVIDLPEKKFSKLLKNFLEDTENIDICIKKELILYCNKMIK